MEMMQDNRLLKREVQYRYFGRRYVERSERGRISRESLNGPKSSELL
jgi:hypothetical protein